ncbi:MAG TPA: apolipoprotein N-acyltransferase [Ideonella sp.]|uniref:apolipoprotein N-acyltransferase n=1 Tax=Ideonella sp. TaxID=1929293 RepID=UPI002E2ECF91|nr:apolipoprotein N-acyltransferase [Ideonella sp.]HEX5683946.1 apolipoprotein N-acyltransferase [Ideonella sp.]
MKRVGFWPLAMLLAGGLHTASFAPLGWWPLQIAALALLAGAVNAATPRQAAVRGFCFSVAWLTSGLWWLYISMHDYGGMPAPLAALAVVVLAAALSLYVAGAMALFAWLRRGRPVPDALGFAACWLLAELARGQFFTGFPWIASGYAHSDGVLAGLAPWIGVYGIGAVAALLAMTLAMGWHAKTRSWRLAMLLVALPIAVQFAPREFTESTGTLRVSLLQPNVAQDLKFDGDRIVGQMAALQAQLQSAQGDLVVTPESVLPIPKDQLDPVYWQQLMAPFRSGVRAALVGTFLGNEQDGYVNSLVGVSAGGERYSYGKRHLLPFGEYVPPGFRWFVDLMQIPLGDQASGRSEAPFVAGGQRLRPLICYEDLFGEHMVDSAVAGADEATMFVNVSNLAWFGRHMVQDQDLQFSRLRSLEFQRPMVRATNTGATAVIDHRGRVTARLPAETAGTLDAEVEGRRGATPYARWLAAFGLWPLWGLGLAGVAGLAAGRAARVSRAAPPRYR